MENKENFQVILLGIVYNTKTKKILIGRRENDPQIKELGWCFPGGEACQEQELEHCLKKRIKEKTNLNTESLGTIFAKKYPEKKDLLAVYYLCELIDGEEKPKDDFKEIKWVNPEELEKYFSTSFHPKLKEYILNLK